MTIREAVQEARKCLALHQVPDADTDALLLLHAVCGIDRVRYYAYPDAQLPDAEAYLEKIRMRAERIPLQQITGEQYFCGLRFLVTEDVLCPRSETELLVEEALKRLRPGDRFLDLCTGSGCIAVSLLSLGTKQLSDRGRMDKTGGNPVLRRTGYVPAGSGSAAYGAGDVSGGSLLRGDACDLSEAALAVARRNASLNGVSHLLCLKQGDLYEAASGTYDLIVSNPPYIPSIDIDALMEEVRDHEPRMALDGGTDGLVFYRRILEGAEEHLKESGWLLVEIGFDQGEEVRSMFDDYRYNSTQVMKDLSGLDRVVIGRRRGGSKMQPAGGSTG